MRVLLGGLIIVAATVIAGCGGGGGSSPSAPSAPVTSGPTSPVPQTAATHVAVGSVAPGATAIPFSIAGPAGYSQVAALPITGTGTTLNIVNSIGPQSAVPALSVARLSGSSRATLGTRTAQADDLTAVFYTFLSPATTITVAGQASLAVTFPSGILTQGASYYLAFYDPTTASPEWNTIAGPVVAASGTLTFAGTIPSYTLIANDVYGLVIFTVGSGGTPPPAPTASPTISPPTPTPVPTVSVGSLFASWTGGNGFSESSVTASAPPGTGTPPPVVTGQTINFASSGQTATVTLTESGFTGAFSGSLSSGCNGNATMSGPAGNTFLITDNTSADFTGCTATFYGLSTAGSIAFPITGGVTLGGGVQ